MLAQTGCVLIRQTADVAPADRKLYALRDATSTVESRPLIASSILSKKVTEGIGALVMDVKVGAGGFMEDINDARELGAVAGRHRGAQWCSDRGLPHAYGYTARAAGGQRQRSGGIDRDPQR